MASGPAPLLQSSPAVLAAPGLHGAWLAGYVKLFCFFSGRTYAASVGAILVHMASGPAPLLQWHPALLAAPGLHNAWLTGSAPFVVSVAVAHMPLLLAQSVYTWLAVPHRFCEAPVHVMSTHANSAQAIDDGRAGRCQAAATHL